MESRPFVSATVALGVLLGGCRVRDSIEATEQAPSAPFSATKNVDGYTDISVEELAMALERHDFTLVNVHVPYEGEIPDTDVSVPYDEIAAHLDRLPSRDQAIVLYCRSGRMSTEAASELVKLGYSQVMELDGGFEAWRDAGLEFIDP